MANPNHGNNFNRPRPVPTDAVGAIDLARVREQGKVKQLMAEMPRFEWDTTSWPERFHALLGDALGQTNRAIQAGNDGHVQMAMIYTQFGATFAQIANQVIEAMKLGIPEQSEHGKRIMEWQRAMQAQAEADAATPVAE